MPDLIRSLALIELPDGSVRMEAGDDSLTLSAGEFEKVKVMFTPLSSPPAPVPVAQLSVLDVLEMCERDFAFIGGCTMTDMPDVPLSPETSWTMDFSRVLAAIDVAKEKLGGFVDCCTAGECVGCSNPQPMEPTSATPKFEPEHLDTGKASKDSF